MQTAGTPLVRVPYNLADRCFHTANTYYSFNAGAGWLVGIKKIKKLWNHLEQRKQPRFSVKTPSLKAKLQFEHEFGFDVLVSTFKWIDILKKT